LSAASWQVDVLQSTKAKAYPKILLVQVSLQQFKDKTSIPLPAYNSQFSMLVQRYYQVDCLVSSGLICRQQLEAKFLEILLDPRIPEEVRMG